MFRLHTVDEQERRVPDDRNPQGAHYTSGNTYGSPRNSRDKKLDEASPIPIQILSFGLVEPSKEMRAQKSVRTGFDGLCIARLLAMINLTENTNISHTGSQADNENSTANFFTPNRFLALT